MRELEFAEFDINGCEELKKVSEISKDRLMEKFQNNKITPLEMIGLIFDLDELISKKEDEIIELKQELEEYRGDY